MMPTPLDPEALARLRVLSAPIIDHLRGCPRHPSWDLDNEDHVNQFLQELLALCRARVAERATDG